jgi:hypothetical protein
VEGREAAGAEAGSGVTEGVEGGGCVVVDVVCGSDGGERSIESGVGGADGGDGGEWAGGDVDVAKSGVKRAEAGKGSEATGEKGGSSGMAREADVEATEVSGERGAEDGGVKLACGGGNRRRQRDSQGVKDEGVVCGRGGGEYGRVVHAHEVGGGAASAVGEQA